MGFGVCGSGFVGQGLGFRDWRLGFKVRSFGCRFLSLGLPVWALGFRVWVLGFRAVWGLRFRVWGLGVRLGVAGLGHWGVVWGSVFGVDADLDKSERLHKVSCKGFKVWGFYGLCGFSS